MHQNKISILSTRPLPAELFDSAAEKNIGIEVISFIEIKMMEDESLKADMVQLSHQPLTIVFTSANAVEAVADCLEGAQPRWKIFCIGSATKTAVEKKFTKIAIAGTADSASALADAIISTPDISSVFFFCGDKRRKELPEKLSKHNIAVNEIVVYKTVETPLSVNKNFDAILFYSPVAVTSFFSVNKINEQTILFAIGNTTADEIKKYSQNKTVVSKKPEKELLVEEAIAFFSANTINH